MDLYEGFLGWARDHLEGPQLEIGLHGCVSELAADKSLGVEDRVELVLDG